jgi:hypothetical protein
LGKGFLGPFANTSIFNEFLSPLLELKSAKVLFSSDANTSPFDNSKKTPFGKEFLASQG